MTDYQEKLNEARANNRNLFGALGETGKGFNAMHDAAVKDGALDLKTKELEAIAIAIAMRCEGCIVQHAKACLKAGVTRDELVETIGIAVQQRFMAARHWTAMISLSRPQNKLSSKTT